MCDEYIDVEEAEDDRDEIMQHSVMELYAEIEYERRIFDSYPHDERWGRAVSSLALYRAKVSARTRQGALTV